MIVPTVWGDAQPRRRIPADRDGFYQLYLPDESTQPVMVAPRSPNLLRRRVIIELADEPAGTTIWLFTTPHPQMATPIPLIDEYGNVYYSNGIRLTQRITVLETTQQIFALTAPILATEPIPVVAAAVGQDDPAISEPIVFTITFDQDVDGFDETGISFTGSTAGGTLVANIVAPGDGQSVFVVHVTGMTTSGDVVISVDAASCTGTIGGLPNVASNAASVEWLMGPLEIFGASMIGWYDGSDQSSMILTGSVVTTWSDKEGSMSAMAASGSPDLVLNALNGQSVVRYNGVNQYHFFNGAPNLLLHDSEVWSLFASDDTTTGVIWSEAVNTNANQALRLLDISASNVARFNASNGTGVDRFNLDQARAAGGWVLSRATNLAPAVGAEHEIVGETPATTGPWSATGFGTANRWSVGACLRGSASSFYDGLIAQIIVLTTPATPTQEQQFYDWLNAKYALGLP